MGGRTWKHSDNRPLDKKLNKISNPTVQGRRKFTQSNPQINTQANSVIPPFTNNERNNDVYKADIPLTANELPSSEFSVDEIAETDREITEVNPPSFDIEEVNQSSGKGGKGYFEESVYFHNLKGQGKTKEVKIKTKFKANAQELRILGAMELQKDAEWEGRTASLGKNAGIKGQSYTHNTLGKQSYYHGNTFKHISNQAGEYMKLSSDGATNSSSAKVDKNKNPVLVKRDSSYNPPKYGDRGLTGIGRISLTGFAGGVHKKGSKTITGKRRTEDSPFSFNWEEPRRSGYERVKNSSGNAFQWMSGLKKGSDTKKILEIQKDNRSKKLSRKDMERNAKQRYNDMFGSVMRDSSMESSNAAARKLNMNASNETLTDSQKVDKRRKELESKGFNSGSSIIDELMDPSASKDFY